MRRALFVVVLAISGCECGEPVTPDGGVDAGMMQSDGGGSDAGNVDAGPSVSFTLNLDRDFGGVLRGQFVERVASITNTGTRTLDLRQFAISGDASFTVMAGTNATVAPQGSTEFTVRFTAGTHGAVTASLDFLADGLQQHTPLTAESIGPAARLMPMLIDLGDVPLYGGTTAVGTADLGVENIGRDTTTHRPDTDLHVTFDVAQLSGDPATVCVNDCLPDALTVAVGSAISPVVRVNAMTPGARRFEVRVFSNDPTQPLLTVEVRFNAVTRPLCQFTTSPIDFGVLSRGEPRVLETVFENVGTEACEIIAAFTDGDMPATPTPVFELVEPQTFPIVVPPGGVQRSLIRATGQGMTPFAASAQLKLEVNAPTRYATAALSAQLEQSPVLIGLTRPLDFGEIQVGCSSRAIPLILEARVGAVQLASPPFQLGNISSGVTTVSFAPTIAGDVHETLEVRWSTDAGVEKTTVELVGTGVAGVQRTETFSGSAGKVDLLFAIDDAPTMLPYASKITQQLSALPSTLGPFAIDYHAGVISCGDVANPGALRTTSTGQRFVTPSTPQVAMRFPELLTVGGQVTGHSCKSNVLHALTFPNVNTVNQGFRREGVPLVVVQITNSLELDTVVAPQVLELGQHTGFMWNAISPTTGLAHLSVVTPSGGVRTDIDGANWAPALTPIVNVASTRERFVLNGKPNASSLAVRINGTSIPSMNNWNWDASANTLFFAPATAPQPSDTVTVTYDAVCAP
ncbi:MAG: choice-of-anchor D domain-containing protein [Archangium sp.]